MTTEATGRIRALDIAKGICITVIVFCHALENAVIEGEGMVVPTGSSVLSDPVSLITQYFYTLLFVFFMISGYLHKPGRTFAQNVWRRFVQIIPTFVICTTVLTFAMWLFVSATVGAIPFEEFLDELFHSLIGNTTFEPAHTRHEIGPCNITLSYYFFIVFIVACVPFYAVVDRVSDSNAKTIASMAVLCGVSAVLIEFLPVHLPFACETAFATAAVMLMGARLAKADVLGRMEREWKTARFWLFTLFMLLFGLAWTAVFPIGYNLLDGILGQYGGVSAFLVPVGTLACGHCFMTLCMAVSRLQSIGKLLSVLGIFSLSVMMFHVFFLKLVAGLFHPITGDAIPIESVPEGIIFGAIAIILSLALSMALSGAIGARRSKKARSL